MPKVLSSFLVNRALYTTFTEFRFEFDVIIDRLYYLQSNSSNRLKSVTQGYPIRETGS